MNVKTNINFSRIFLIGILLFFICFNFITNLVIVFAEKAKENNYEKLRNDIVKLEETMKNLEKENIILKEENINLKRENINFKQENTSLKIILKQDTAKQVPVLLYHHLYDGDLDNSPFKGNGSVISVDSFREQMSYLKDNDFYTATLDELEKFINKEIDLPKKTVVITFDDGYYSNIEYAYPILKENSQKAAIFIIGKDIQNTTNKINSFNTLKFLGYEDIKNTSDVFEFHNHTYDLHKYINNKPALTVVGKVEIMEDFTKMERFNTEYLAYPFGGYNEITIEALKDMNYKLAFTTREGYVSHNSNKYEIPRIIIWPTTNLERFEKIVNPR